MTAQEILAAARERAAERLAGQPMAVDYDALNRMVRRQHTALTRAVNSHDPRRVVVVCRDAVLEWSKPGAMWPDDWSRWQRALDDALPWNQSVNLSDLA